MKQRAVKAVVIALELCAILIAVFCAGGIFLYWRLGQGPVSLDLFKSSVEYAIERRLPSGFDANIADLELHRTSDERGGYHIAVMRLAVLDPSEKQTVYAPHVDFHFSVEDFFLGAFGPRSIRADGAQFNIIRNRDFELQIPGAPKPDRLGHSGAAPSGGLSAVFSKGLLKSAFQEAVINDAEVTFLDEASGRSWSAPNAAVSVWRAGGVMTASLQGELDVEGEAANLRLDAKYTDESDVVSVSAEGENFPLGDVIAMFYGEGAAVLEAPVSGRASALLTGEGDVMSSSFEAEVGAGVLKLGGTDRPLSHVGFKAFFAPEQNDFTIEHLAFDVDGTSGVIDGVVRVAFADDIRKPSLVLFDLALRDFVLDAGDALPEPVVFDDFAVAGGYQVEDRRLNVNQFNAGAVDVAAAGDFEFIFPRQDASGKHPSMGVTGELALEGALDPQRLLKIWPRPAATGARDWVEARMETARIDNVKAVFNFAPGALVEGSGMPEDALNVTFDVQDAKAHFIEGMTPLTGAAGSGLLRGNSFRLRAERGKVGSIAITNGEVDFPTFMPKWEPTYYRFTASGASQDLLSVLDEEPLLFLTKANLSPDQFVGKATAEIEIMRPNKRYAAPEEYGYKGTAKFDNMTVTGLAGEVELIEMTGGVDLKTRSMKVTGDALLAGEAPIKLVWNQNFFEEDGPSNIEVEGEIDSSTGDLFGIPSREFLHGPVGFSAVASGDLGAIESLDIEADFTAASLTFDALGWRKAAGNPARGDLSVTFSEDVVAIQSINITGDSIELDGKMDFALGGGLQSADLRRIYLTGAADFSLKAVRDAAGALSLTAIGKFLNAAPLIEQAFEMAPNGSGVSADEAEDLGPGFSVTARLDQLLLRNGVEYASAAFDVRRDARGLQALDFSAIGRDGAPLRINMELTGDEMGSARMVEVRSNSIGDLMGGVFGMASVSGGEGTLRLNLPRPEQTEITGVFEGRDLHIVNAPMLARIFSAGSLDGLSNLMNGKGIDFSYAYGEFDFDEGVVMINNARATGPSVGITAEGGLATGDGGEISLTGAVAPIYQLNSVLGNAPIIGDILVGKKGEGVLALSYSVSGERASPSVFVNPLSALTPGVFRQLIQPARTDEPSQFVEPIPEAAATPPAQ